MAKRPPFKRPAAAAITAEAPRKKQALQSAQEPKPAWVDQLKASKADNVLQASLKHFVGELPTALEESFWHAAGKQWVLASACTGTGMAELAHHAIMEFRGVPSTIELCSEKVLHSAKGGAVETGCSGLHYYVLFYYVMLPPSTAPLSHCTPLC